VQKRTAIDADETALELEPRLAELGAPAVIEAIELVAKGAAGVGIPQDAQLATKAPRLSKADGLVDWSRPAAAIRNQVRALQPWPKTYTFWQRSGAEPLRLILEQVATADDQAVDLTLLGQRPPPPGTAIVVDKELAILCGIGAVLPQIVQPAGKRTMSIGEFLRGHPVQVGDQFGNE
jgi:methionyl-tRNA formyltransferase